MYFKTFFGKMLNLCRWLYRFEFRCVCDRINWNGNRISYDDLQGANRSLSFLTNCTHSSSEEKWKRLLTISLFFIGFIAHSSVGYAIGHVPLQIIKSRDAIYHLGESLILCGPVSNVSRRERVTFVNFDYTYPNQTLTAVVWSDARILLFVEVGDKICVYGELVEYKGKPQIEIEEVNQMVFIRDVDDLL